MGRYSGTDADPREAIAIDAAEVGADHASACFRTELNIEQKGDAIDLVAEVDRGTQRRIIVAIRERFPDDAVVGEEDDELKTVPESGYVWTIDLIDGTQSYAWGARGWVTSVAVVENQTPIATVNVSPETGNTYAATATRVERNGRLMTVNDESNTSAFLVSSTLQYQVGDQPGIERLSGDIFGTLDEMRKLGTMQPTLSRLVDGLIDAIIGFDEHPNAWDTVAGVYLIERAGGAVTGIHGNAWGSGQPGLVASSGHAHDEVFEATQAVFEETR